MTNGTRESMKMTETMKWTVIYDSDARFLRLAGISHCFRRCARSRGPARRAPWAAAGRIEAFALAAPRDIRPRIAAGLRMLGASYVCEAGRCNRRRSTGRMAGGAMFELLRDAAR